MAAPNYVVASTGETDATGSWTHNLGSSFMAGSVDIIIVQLLQDGDTDGAISNISGARCEDLAGTNNQWTKIPGTNADGSWPVGTATARQHLYIGRSLATQPSFAPYITGDNSTSEDVYIRGYGFKDVSTGTTLATVIENVTAGSTTNESGTSATASDASVTTLGPDRLALNFIAVNDDNVIAQFSGQTGGGWDIVEQYAESSGTDGAIGIQFGYLGASFIVPPFTLAAAAVQGGTSGTNNQVAQAFQCPTGAATSGIVGLYKTGSPTDDVVVEIQTDNGGIPSGTVVGTGGTIVGSTLPTSSSYQSIALSASLSASTTYWLVVRRSGARDTSNYYNVGYRSGNLYSSNAATMSSGTWNVDTTNDYAFGVAIGTGSTINGGTASITDPADAWGVVGFALIGTTVAESRVPRSSPYPQLLAH